MLDLAAGSVLALSGLTGGLLLQGDRPAGDVAFVGIAVGVVVQPISGLIGHALQGRRPSSRRSPCRPRRAAPPCSPPTARTSTRSASSSSWARAIRPGRPDPGLVHARHRPSSPGTCSTTPGSAATSTPSAATRRPPRASGIRINKIKMKAFLINGALRRAWPGCSSCPASTPACPTAGIGFEFDALTATVIGGTSFSGGIGTAAGHPGRRVHHGLPRQHHEPDRVDSYMQQIIRGADHRAGRRLRHLLQAAPGKEEREQGAGRCEA